MRVIGVDPGYDRLGVAVLEYTTNGKETVLFSTCVETDKKQSLPDRIHTLGKVFAEIVEQYDPDTLAIETLFFNQNRTTAIGVAAVRGVIMYLAKQSGCEVFEYGPQEIKVAITGYGNSDKAAVTDMVQRLVANAPTGKLDDEYDAIAVATTCLATHGRTR
jgi:crossover junction endodeoxyribonuclease RuvC